MINIKLNVKEYVERKKQELKEKFRSTENPKLFIITDSEDNVATQSYLKSKIRVGSELGVDVQVKYIKTITDIVYWISYCNEKHIPMILQLPTKDKEIEKIYNEFKSQVDVDGFFSYEEIYKGLLSSIVPATPKGIVNYIEDWAKFEGYKSMQDLSVTILGRGNLVGKPLVMLLANKVGSINLITSKSPLSLKQYAIKNSNIVILATGNQHSLDGVDDFGSNKLIVDTGIFRDENNKLCGELTKHLHKLNEDVVDYTPVPGGVGLLTTLNLFENVYSFYKK